jgi:hypothetical protein
MYATNICVYMFIYSHTMKYYSVFKIEGLSFATWKSLEDIRLTEIDRHRKTNTT